MRCPYKTPDPIRCRLDVLNSFFSVNKSTRAAMFFHLRFQPWQFFDSSSQGGNISANQQDPNLEEVGGAKCPAVPVINGATGPHNWKS